MNETPNPATTAAPNAAPAPAHLKQEIGRAVIGQGQVIDELLICLIAGGHALLEGLPGLGKTLLCRSLAQACGGRFARIQFTPDLMPADITGHTIFNPKDGVFVARRGPVFTNLLLADEINRAPAKTQSALLEVMQEYQVTIDGRSFPVPRPFMTVATQNPIELEGTYPLPEAQLDRFLMKILVPYPEAADEVRLVTEVVTGKASDALDVSAVRQVLEAEQVLALQQRAGGLAVDGRIVEYAVAITRESRSAPGIATGGSPRAAIAMIRAARAAAVLAGRDFVTPDDVKQCAPGVLRHRVRLTPEFEIEGHTPDQLVATLLGQVPAPRQ